MKTLTKNNKTKNHPFHTPRFVVEFVGSKKHLEAFRSVLSDTIGLNDENADARIGTPEPLPKSAKKGDRRWFFHAELSAAELTDLGVCFYEWKYGGTPFLDLIELTRFCDSTHQL